VRTKQKKPKQKPEQIRAILYASFLIASELPFATEDTSLFELFFVAAAVLTVFLKKK
jgi:hypothetical protein